MQLSFDPQNCGVITLQAIVDILRLFHPGEIEKMVGAPVVSSGATSVKIDVVGLPPPGMLAAAGLGTDADRPDNRDPAAVFGASATPLPLPALSTAGAGPLPTAPGGLPVLPPTALPGTLLPAAAGLPPAGAPSASAAQTNLAGGVDVDVHGLPWHADIHASTKRKNADGSWTAKKKVAPETVAAITAQLRQIMALPSAAPLALAPAAAAPAVPSAPAAAPATLPLPLPAVAGVPANFDELMPRITAGVTAGVLEQDTLLKACQAHQLPSLVALTSRPDYVAHIWNYLKGQYPALV